MYERKLELTHLGQMLTNIQFVFGTVEITVNQNINCIVLRLQQTIERLILFLVLEIRMVSFDCMIWFQSNSLQTLELEILLQVQL
jgi:hypothetical protein